MKRSSGSVLLSGLVLLIALGAGACSSDKNSGTTAPPTAKELNSGDIAASGGVFAHTFHTAGTFNYHCIYHSPMTGVVTVLNDTLSPLNASVSITSSTAPFTAATVRVNGSVTWTNNTAAIHTVTSN